MSHPFENLDPAQTVKVLPRHLAGPGAVDPRTAWAFPFDEGWPFAQTDAGTAAAFSPCLRLQTTYDPQPDEPGKGTWTISAHRAPFTPPAWRITFDATTPVELLHDVHTELLDLYLEDRHSDQDRLFQDETAPHEAYAPLLARGWSHAVKTDGTQSFLTPEGLGGVRHRYAINASSGAAWRAWGGYLSEPHCWIPQGPGTPVTVTVTNSKTATGSSPSPTKKATAQPTSTATTQSDKTVGGTSARPADSATPDTDSSPAPDAADETTSKIPAGSLSHTGADASPWFGGGAGILIASGIGMFVAARARRSDANTPAGED
ncbi:DUF317 domain-containing protein [Streptomyces pseudovenezuelae]|uniref:DUF317 domain-containing protein n=1 Tax=Streptomyces pseudovenezuelae TaxID=67350 RepID=UPI002E31EFD2|nr:DUF317 domain-containing protein [Streptomyces pseudovenezuelae]